MSRVRARGLAIATVVLLLESRGFAQAPGAPSPAAAAAIARGAQVFAQSCAVGYCHGSRGTANRGPRLAGRAFDRVYLERVIRSGIPGKAMPPWGATLGDADLKAVLAYVVSLSGGASVAAASSSTGPAAEPARFEGPPEARRGKELFFDAGRSVRCGTCHVLDGWGVAVGPNLLAKPIPTAAAVRALPAPGVALLRTRDGDSFAALPADQRDDLVRVYDLTSSLPVLRTLRAADVTWSPAAPWKHGSAIASYGDRDLDSIVRYLRWLASRM
jgi:mono/diheme cytochrome c family protein